MFTVNTLALIAGIIKPHAGAFEGAVGSALDGFEGDVEGVGLAQVQETGADGARPAAEGLDAGGGGLGVVLGREEVGHGCGSVGVWECGGAGRHGGTPLLGRKKFSAGVTLASANPNAVSPTRRGKAMTMPPEEVMRTILFLSMKNHTRLTVALRQQARILEELGLEAPGEAAEEIQQQVERDEATLYEQVFGEDLPPDSPLGLGIPPTNGETPD